MNKISVVIVTYNRKDLLLRCLNAVWRQTRQPDNIVIVDNASTDGTREILQTKGWLQRLGVELLALNENTGGAGGFAAGIDYAASQGTDWIWIMDDDAEPHLDALEQLLNRSLATNNLYGSVAVSEGRLSWPMMPNGGRAKDAIYDAHLLPDQIDVQFIPFLGLLISSKLIERIGLPDAGFFIAADDVDYCMRARQSGAQILLVGASQIEHPASERYKILLPGKEFYSLRLTPWKRYYDVRNRLFVARNHYGAALYYSTIPGSFLRLTATLWHEKQRMRQIWAFIAGMTDGLLGRKGRRHQLWGIDV